MPPPVAQASVVLNLVYDQLGVAPNAYGVFTDKSAGPPRWQQAALVNWLADADLEVQRACADTAGSFYRNYFVQTSPAILINSGDPLPTNAVGPPQAIFIMNYTGITTLGTPAPSTWIRYFNSDSDNVFGNGTQFTDGYYSVIDARVYFSGKKASVYYCAIARPTVPALPSLPTLASPEAFTNTLAALVISFATMKEEDYVTEAQLSSQKVMADLQSIRGGAMETAPIQLIQKSAA
jgi:hypothetical protein